MNETVIEQCVDACRQGPSAARLAPVLDRVIADPSKHARFVNTLSRLEYVGVRKMLKSRRAERLDLDGLQHLLDEAVHALRLKKAAVALAALSGTTVTTFSTADTLMGDVAEDYFQELDRSAEQILSDGAPASDAVRSEANYLLTSAAIEVRAQIFYPLYEQCLRAHGAPFSVSSITKDEDRHLAEMAEALAHNVPNWRACLEAVLREEERLFGRLLTALERDLNSGGDLRSTSEKTGTGQAASAARP